MYQNLESFRLPPGFRGRSAFVVQLWWIVQSVLFGLSPQFAFGFRRWLLRLFGAKIGQSVLIRPTARITYPWYLSIGDHAWIGDDVVLYSLGPIEIGANSVISQRSYICAADHDAGRSDFEIRAKAVCIKDQVWIATDVFVGPGVTIEQAAVVGARSSVFGNLPAAMICFGSPCRPVRARSMTEPLGPPQP